MDWATLNWTGYPYSYRGNVPSVSSNVCLGNSDTDPSTLDAATCIASSINFTDTKNYTVPMGVWVRQNNDLGWKEDRFYFQINLGPIFEMFTVVQPSWDCYVISITTPPMTNITWIETDLDYFLSSMYGTAPANPTLNPYVSSYVFGVKSTYCPP